jgi:hypothetical protein
MISTIVSSIAMMCNNENNNKDTECVSTVATPYNTTDALTATNDGGRVSKGVVRHAL